MKSNVSFLVAEVSLTIKLRPSLFRPNTNNGRKARMELYRFKTPAGKYKLELTEGSSISAAENNILRVVPARMADYDKYFIQIRESQPRFIAMIGIGLIALAGFLSAQINNHLLPD